MSDKLARLKKTERTQPHKRPADINTSMRNNNINNSSDAQIPARL